MILASDIEISITIYGMHIIRLGFGTRERIVLIEYGPMCIANRFERRVYIPLPGIEARRYLLKNVMKINEHSLNDDDF